jgi:uncharacterized protein YbjT (DUF2867 family)
MRCLVIGATGRAGRLIAEELLASGHSVRALARSARAEVLPPGAEPFPGDVLDPEALRGALYGCEAVISALSIPRAGSSPFAAITGPRDLHSRSAALLLPVMRDAGVRRFIKISAQSVGDSAPRAGWGFRLLVAASNLRVAFADHGIADAAVATSDLDWTVVRPPMLGEGPPGAVRAGEQVTTGTFTRLPRASLARWVTEIVADEQWFRRTVSLAPA